MSATGLRALALRDVHEAAGARFAPFAGWDMPLQYEGIVTEHLAVRGRAGVFDVSHMGRVWVEGREATARLRSALTYDIRPLAPGEAHYALYCTEAGGIADDVFAFRLARSAGSSSTTRRTRRAGGSACSSSGARPRRHGRDRDARGAGARGEGRRRLDRR